MENIKRFAKKAAKAAAERALKRDANNTTCFAIFQPKSPAKLSQFKINQK